MICCSNCGHVVSLPTPVRDPACRCHSSHEAHEADATSPADDSYRPIARFANAAEAGYFAHELAHRLDFDPVVRSEQDFDAIGAPGGRRTCSVLPSHSPTRRPPCFMRCAATKTITRIGRLAKPIRGRSIVFLPIATRNGEIGPRRADHLSRGRRCC